MTAADPGRGTTSDAVVSFATQPLPSVHAPRARCESLATVVDVFSGFPSSHRLLSSFVYSFSDDYQLSESFQSPQTPKRSWSTQIAERYQCGLSQVLADWFDTEIWRRTGTGEYREPVSPEVLLDETPEVIWPGLMSCDLLPLIGNAAGDWLCIRIGEANTMGEVIQWYHGGGDWIPWGNDLAEAIVFDAAVERIPGAARRHATPAENPRPHASAASRKSDPLLQWALSHVSPLARTLFDAGFPEGETSELLLRTHIAEVAVRCEKVVSLLTHWPRDLLNALFLQDRSLDRAQLARWSFDLDQIPAGIRNRLVEQAGFVPSQDWEAAAEHALQVSRLAPELAWPWEIAGYAAERKADVGQAVELYRQAARCSVFTDQSIRLDTHWSAPESAKFSVARLKQLAPDQVAESDYYRILCHPDTRQRRRLATEYWDEQAACLLSQQRYREAHGCYVAAAWDLGAEPISRYAGLLESIQESAGLSDQPGRAALAATHRRCLRDRYGV